MALVRCAPPSRVLPLPRRAYSTARRECSSQRRVTNLTSLTSPCEIAQEGHRCCVHAFAAPTARTIHATGMHVNQNNGAQQMITGGGTINQRTILRLRGALLLLPGRDQRLDLGAHWIEVMVRHGLRRGKPLLVVVAQQLVQEVQRLGRDEVLVLCRAELLPRLARMAPHQRLEMRVQLDAVARQVGVQLLGAQHLSDLNQLVVVVVPVEEWLLAENHAREHGAQRPHVQRVVVVLQVHQQLGPLEVPARHAHVVLLARVVELGQPPVDQSQLALLVVDHHVVRLDVAVHDALRVAVLERAQQLKDVVADVVVRQPRVEHLEVGVVYVLEDEAGRLGLRVTHDVHQLDGVRPAAQVLQDLDLALDLLLLDRLKNLDDAALVLQRVYTLEHLAVLSAAHLANNLIVILLAPGDRHRLVVPILLGARDVDVGKNARARHDHVAANRLPDAVHRSVRAVRVSLRRLRAGRGASAPAGHGRGSPLLQLRAGVSLPRAALPGEGACGEATRGCLREGRTPPRPRG
mmetsp:Transcript_9124/g.28278  ORF Transcript_9124/g.28278 Transcript_9124/m.28278 type:complete len:520 (-) Transcript_9124:64-1623(-)